MGLVDPPFQDSLRFVPFVSRSLCILSTLILVLRRKSVSATIRANRKPPKGVQISKNSAKFSVFSEQKSG